MITPTIAIIGSRANIVAVESSHVVVLVPKMRVKAIGRSTAASSITTNMPMIASVIAILSKLSSF